jgi:type I restriction enzyme R subunit
VDGNILAERVEYLGPDGKMITESYRDFSRKQIQPNSPRWTTSCKRWNRPRRRQAAIIDELEEYGIVLDNLAKEVGKDYGDFDLICHIAFDQPPLTRKSAPTRSRSATTSPSMATRPAPCWTALLDKYADEGIASIETPRCSSASIPSRAGHTRGNHQRHLWRQGQVRSRHAGTGTPRVVQARS